MAARGEQHVHISFSNKLSVRRGQFQRPYWKSGNSLLIQIIPQTKKRILVFYPRMVNNLRNNSFRFLKCNPLKLPGLTGQRRIWKIGETRQKGAAVLRPYLLDMIHPY